MDRQRPQRFVDGGGWQIGIEAHQRRAQIAGEHSLRCVLAAERAARPESFVVPGIDGIPVELVLQMRGESRLHQPVLAVDICHCHCIKALKVVLAGYADSFSANIL